jgi:hypothetical protein
MWRGRLGPAELCLDQGVASREDSDGLAAFEGDLPKGAQGIVWIKDGRVRRVGQGLLAARSDIQELMGIG